MEIIQAIILGIVEGFTEFLPISSTGHLILVSKLLNIKDSPFLSSFEISIQLGAIFSVVWLYWRRVWHNRDLIKVILAAFIPTAVIGLIMYPIVKNYLFGNHFVVLVALAVGGILLIIFEKFYSEKENAIDDLKKISYKQAVIIGLCQTVAIVPGVSRAAATIIGGLGIGLKRKVIVEFSFLLAVPTMLAATALDLLKTGYSFTSNEWFLLAIGALVSFIIAYYAIKFLISYIQKNNFSIFGIYRIVIALIFWLILLK